MKSKMLLFCFLLAMFVGCNNKTTQKEEENSGTEIPETISEEEIFTIEDLARLADSGTLETKFENSNIKKETQSVNEGMDTATVWLLFPETRDEVRIDFRPDDSTKVWRISVSSFDSKFSSKTGVKVGMTLDELNILNQKAVDFFGFGWDYGGAVKFNNGKLENKNIFVYLKTDADYGKEFIGDTPYSSEETGVAGLELYVGKIVFQVSKL